MRSLHYVIFSLLFVTPQPVLALQWAAETSRAIDEVFAEYDRTSGPGCAVGVDGDGRAGTDGGRRTGTQAGWRTGGGWRTSYLIDFDKVGDGGLYSSVADLARWDRAFYGDVLGVPGFAERMYRRGVLTGGDTIAYARGLSVGERRGLARVSHGGGFMAFRTMIARYPEQRTTVITLCNVGTAQPGALSTAVEDIVLADAFTEAPQEPVAPTSPAGAPDPAAEPPFAVSAAAVRALAGSYHSPELDATWRLEADGTSLLLHHPRGDTETLTARREGVFGSGGIEFAFEREGGRGVAFLLAAGRVRNLRFDRTDLP